MQTAAILMDSLRMMLARRLFWITLAISALIVLVYGSIGSNQEGLSIMFGLWTVEFPMLANDSEAYRAMMAYIFSQQIVGIWLTWGAIILALVSTTSIFPDFQTQGSIDLVLAKPISRVKVFFVKYLGSLLFVGVQVGLFCAGVFLILGLRLGDWNWTVLAGVPIVLLFYSYLYAVNAFIGIAFRSTIAALMLTLVFWFIVFVIHTGAITVNGFKAQTEAQIEQLDEQIERQERRLSQAERPGSIGEALRASTVNPERTRERLDELEQERAETQTTAESLAFWHDTLDSVAAVLPKTGETAGLLDRWIRADYDVTPQEIFDGDAPRGQEREAPREGASSSDQPPSPDDAETEEDRRGRQRELGETIQEQVDAVSPWYIIGTSLGFEAVVLGLACFIFVRRDY